jgi:RNA recognition motif-containing protein
MIMGRTINIREDREDGKAVTHQTVAYSAPPPAYDPTTSGVIGKRVFVGNLSFDVTWQELKDLMKQGKPQFLV